MAATGIDHDATTAIPVLRYRDLPAAVEWLCRTLGFKKQLVVADEAGSMRLAHLVLGNSIIMLAPVRETKLDRLMVQPDQVGGAETQITYFFVADTAAHFARAKAAGAEIVLDDDDMDQVKRGYSCRDPEGHIWSFGTYNPRGRRSDRAVAGGRSRMRAALSPRSVSLSLALIALGAVIVWAYSSPSDLLSQMEFTPAVGAPSVVVTPHPEAASAPEREYSPERLPAPVSAPLLVAKEAAELATQVARDQLAAALKREGDEKAVTAKLRQELELARSATAEEAARVSERDAAQLARLQSEKEASERAVDEALRQLARERRAREVAETAASEARSLAAKERNAREGAQRASRELEARLVRERGARSAPKKPSNPEGFSGIP